MRKVLNYLTPLILCWMYIIPLLQLITDTFELSVRPSAILHLLALSMLLWIARCFSRPAVPAGLGCVIYLGCLLLTSSDGFIPQVQTLIDRVLHTYGERYPFFALSLVTGADVSDVTLAAVALIFLVTAIVIGTLTASSARISATVLSTVPVFFLAICVNGEPAEWQIATMLIFWALVFATGPSFLPEQDSCGKIFAAALIPTAMLVCTLLLAVSPSEYDYAVDQTQIGRRMEALGAKVSAVFGMNGNTSAPVSRSEGSTERAYTPGHVWGNDSRELDMSRGRADVDDTQEILRVTADTDGYLYLRGFSYGYYTGTGWGCAPDAPVTSLAFTHSALSCADSAVHNSAQIEYISVVRELTYLPYYAGYDAQDSCIPYSGADSYTVDYITYSDDLTALRVPDAFSAGELTYRDFAHSVYTQLPESTAQELTAIAAENGIYPGDPEISDKVAQLVRSQVAYSLSTQPYPTDDYAVYFFTEAQTGYCVHYATAACAMFRALGIPSRVVDGFLAQTSAGQISSVLQGQEHAWVEIYTDGLGWIPVEVTGSYAADGAYAEYSAVSHEPEAQQPADPASDDHAPKSDATEADAADAAGSSKPPRSVGLTVLRTLIIVLIVIIILYAAFCRRYAHIALRRSSFNQRNKKKAAIAVWKYAKRLEAYGGTMPEFIELNAEKAFYSQHEITRVEMRCALELVKTMAQETYASLDKRKRFVFKYVHGLI